MKHRVANFTFRKSKTTSVSDGMQLANRLALSLDVKSGERMDVMSIETIISTREFPIGQTWKGQANIP